MGGGWGRGGEGGYELKKIIKYERRKKKKKKEEERREKERGKRNLWNIV